MPFPLPIDPDFVKEVIRDWVTDIDDRLDLGDIGGAENSLRIAQGLYLSLPPGKGDFDIEEALVEGRVKIDQHS